MRGWIRNLNSSSKASVIIEESDFLGDFVLDYSMMSVPLVTLTLPIKYSKYISGNTHIHLVTDDFVYEGYVLNKQADYSNMTVRVPTSHVIGRLSKRTLPTNVTVKERSVKSAIEQVMGYWSGETHKDDLLNKFKIEYVDDYANQNLIEYEFSRESFLEFMTKVCEKTQNLYWRVSRYDPYKIEFGIFGKKRDVLISEVNHLIGLNGVEENYEDIVNVAVVMSDKSDSGASTLTLRDIFYNPKLMVKGFPVIKTGNKINSQRIYDYPQLPIFAPEIIGDEFALLDEEGIAQESGEFYWGTITNNDTQSIAEENKEITDNDRIKATEQMYHTAIRRIKNSRRKVLYPIDIEPFRAKSFQVGDRVMFKLNIPLWELTNCSRYYEKILRESDWFFVTKIQDKFSVGNSHIQTLELSKYLYSENDNNTNS